MPEITIQELRKKYPDRTDLSDQELASRYESATGNYTVLFEPRPSKLMENLVGYGEIDTVGEDVGAAIGSGMERAASGIIGLPGAVLNTVEMGLDKIGMGMRDEGDRSFGFPEAMAFVDRVTGDERLPDMAKGVGTDYEPQTTAGKYVQTGADFVGSMVAPGSGTRVVRNALAPALVSETAGQATENTALEAPARILGALFGGRTLDVFENALMGGRVDPKYAAAVKALEARGVRPTAGQATDSPTLLAAESSSRAGGALLSTADQSFTQAALQTAIPKSLRSVIDVPRGTDPLEAVDTIKTGIGSVMDQLAARNSVPINDNLRGAFDLVAKKYKQVASAGGKSPYFESLVEELKSVTDLSGQGYQYHRSQISSLTKSPDPLTRDAAITTLGLLDDAMEASIRNQGNKTDVARYRDARTGYRDALILEKTLLGPAARDVDPVITPIALSNATKSKDIKGYLKRESVFSDLSRNANTVLKKTPDSGTANRLAAGVQALQPGALGASAGYAMSGGNPTMAVVGGALGQLAPPLRNRILASPAAQAYFKATARPGDRAGITSIPAAISASRQGQY